MYAILKCEQWQIKGYSRCSSYGGRWQRLISARTERDLLIAWEKLKKQREALGAHNNTLLTYSVIRVWNSEKRWLQSLTV